MSDIRNSQGAWKSVSILSLADYLNGYPFKPHQLGKEGTRVIRIEQLRDPEGFYDHHAGELEDRFVIDDGDLIFSWSATLMARIWNHGRAYLNQHLFKVVPNAGTDRGFLLYVLNDNVDRMALTSQGSTMRHITRKDLGKFQVRIPDPTTQRTIARILGTVDGLIERTEALIAKQQQIKQGLLQDLFTRGVDAQGALRPPHSEAPELYHETALGWLPKGWRVERMDVLKEFITSGSRGWAAYYSDDGPLFIRIGNLTREHINFRWEDVQYVKPPLGGEGSRTVVQEGDLLISITADLGITAVVPQDLSEAYVNQHIALVRLNREKTNPRWVGMYLASRMGQQQFARLNDSGTKAGLNLPTIAALQIANPPKSERDHIVQLLDEEDRLIACEKRNLEKYRAIKSGLMQDLLTGRVSVEGC